jgi:hypothetical protein
MDMDSSRREDPRLSEVKAVLQRLQRISAGPEVQAEQLAAEQALRRRGWGLSVSLGLAAGALVAVGAFVFIDPARLLGPSASRERQLPAAVTQPVPSTTKLVVVPGGNVSPPLAAQSQIPPRPALEAAMGMLSAGRVQAARRQLLAIASEDAADVAWALARSYDPNFLSAIPGPDAGPDVTEAARWYRAWHASAVRQGLVTESVSLERIIGAMR